MNVLDIEGLRRLVTNIKNLFATKSELETGLSTKQDTLTNMTSTEANTGTSTTARSISAKVIHDKISSSISTGSNNGAISVNGTDVSVKGLKSGAYEVAYTHPTTAGNKHIPSGGSTGQILRYSSSGTAVWSDENDTTYSVFVGSGSNAASGLVPKPSTTAGTTKYLREDGSWEVPPDTKYTHPTTAGNKHIPTGGSSGQILRYSSSGTAVWSNENDTTYSDFVGSGTGASSGLVPAPSTTAGTTKYLREDGTWEVPPDTKYTHPTTSGNKHIPSGGSSGQFLKWSADGTAVWANDNNTTYTGADGITLTGTKFTNSGVRSIDTGTTNGTISVNTNGTSLNVAVKGLGSAAYTNSSDYLGATDTATDSSKLGGTAAASYAKLASPTFTGTPKAPTATAGTNTTQIATTEFVQTAVSGLVDSAPTTLDTLNELAAALGDDPNFATTIATQIGTKLDADSANYIKSLSISGKTITYTKGDDTTGTLTTQDTVYTHPTSAGNKHIPAGGSSGQILRWSSAGTAAWGAENDTTYSVFVGSGTGAASGLVPTPSTTAGTTKYLREDGTWEVPPDTKYTHPTTSGNKHIPSGGSSGQILKWSSDGTATWANEYSYTHPTSAGNKHIPSGGSSGQILRWSSSGTAVWGAENDTTYNDFVGSGTNAASGLVPAPSTTAGTTKYLREDGTWAVPPDNDTVYTHPTTSGNKHIPSGGSSGQILKWSADGTATWAAEYSYTHPTTAGNKHIPSGGATGNILVYSAAGTAAWGTNAPTATSAGKLTTGVAIDGVTFDGSAAITHYGTCATAAGTAAKTVACTNYTLVTGSRIIVKFTVTNTAANPTLNVNSTGAKAIQYRGSAITAGILSANRTYAFVYDGTNYQLVGDIDTVYTHPTTSGNKHIPSGGSSGQILKWSSDGTATWANEYSYTHPTTAGNKHIPTGGSTGEVLVYGGSSGTATWNSITKVIISSDSSMPNTVNNGDIWMQIID